MAGFLTCLEPLDLQSVHGLDGYGREHVEGHVSIRVPVGTKMFLTLIDTQIQCHSRRSIALARIFFWVQGRLFWVVIVVPKEVLQLFIQNCVFHNKCENSSKHLTYHVWKDICRPPITYFFKVGQRVLLVTALNRNIPRRNILVQIQQYQIGL